MFDDRLKPVRTQTRSRATGLSIREVDIAPGVVSPGSSGGGRVGGAWSKPSIALEEKLSRVGCGGFDCYSGSYRFRSDLVRIRPSTPPTNVGMRTRTPTPPMVVGSTQRESTARPHRSPSGRGSSGSVLVTGVRPARMRLIRMPACRIPPAEAPVVLRRCRRSPHRRDRRLPGEASCKAGPGPVGRTLQHWPRR